MADETFDYVRKQLTVLPTYDSVFGEAASEAALKAPVSKYPVIEWLSFLSRIQTVLAGYRINDDESRQRVFWGALGPRVRQALDRFKVRMLDNGAQAALFYERQLSTLQQFAILHAPEAADQKLETNEGRDDLGVALLVTAELMMHRRGDLRDPAQNLACRVHDQIRMSPLPAPVYAGRAYHFYELASECPSLDLKKYLELFESATGVNATDFILGGLTIAIHEEIGLLENRYEGWHMVPPVANCVNPRQAECMEAYFTVRRRALADIRCLIRTREGDRFLGDWNLAAISASPVVDLHDVGTFVLNLTAVGRSLFDGVRHAILTAALRKRLPEEWNDPGAIGGPYGRIFEHYVEGVLARAFPGRVTRIPTAEEERADFVIPFSSSVVVLEVKGEHFIGLDHASTKTLDQRRKEIDDVGIPKAIGQIACTIEALRKGEIEIAGVSVDWTITPIVPVIVTEERLPQVVRCWDELYAPLMEPLNKLQGAGPVAPFRLISVDDLEIVPDIRTPDDFGTACLKWANDPDFMDAMLPTYLAANGFNWSHRLIMDRFLEATRFLSERLGLDADKLRPEFVEAAQATLGPP